MKRKKPKVTKQWIEKKAEELFGWVATPPYTLRDCKKFICSLLKEAKS